jgi:SPP1 gp7 family putative phage head morphogenesis protein
MPEPKVIQAINAQRANLLAHEADTMREMASRWMKVEDAIRADMLELAIYLDELRLKGEAITPARLMQMDRYKALIADARAQHEQYSRWLADSLADDQRALVQQGITDAQGLITAAMQDARLKSMIFDRINVSAVEFMIGFAADGSPLYDLLRASYPESVVRLTDALIQGIASGKGPRATAQRMVEDMAGNLDRALLIARTEQLRALRAGSLEQMDQSGVVSGYIRRAQLTPATCPACLALDGKEQDTSEVFASHPACRCFAQPKLKYGKTPSFPSGVEWFETLDPDAQFTILGKSRYELFKNGQLDWGNVAKIHNDPVWGPTIKQGTIEDLTR